MTILIFLRSIVRIYVLLFAILTTLALLESTTAYGATYYVSPAGSDSNPGTITQPFKSFARGVSPLSPGDTLYLREGTYTERIDLVTPNKTGTANAWLRIAGYPGEKIIIRYTSPTEAGYGPIRARGNRGYIVFENFVLDGINETNFTKWQIVGGNHHFILRNLEIKNFKSTAIYIEGDDITIASCKIHDGDGTNAGLKRFYGIYAHHSNNIVIENNEIYNQPGGGLHLYPGPHTNLIIRGNSLHHNGSRDNINFGGMIIQGQSTASVINAQVYNNVVFNNGTPASGPAHGIVIGYYTNGTKVWNNTVYGNKGYGIYVGYNFTTVDTTVQNNIIYGNVGGEYINKGAGTIYDHNLTTDPKFLGLEPVDFRLQSRSAGIDGGIAISEVISDFRNVRRPKGRTFDIGAYEYDGSSSAPLSPSELSIQ